MNRWLAPTFSALLVLWLVGCVSRTMHRFEGLGTSSNKNSPKISAAQFFKTKEERWLFTITSSDWLSERPTMSTPHGFVIRSDEPDFELRAFTVLGKDGVSIPFVQLSPTYGDDPPNPKPGVFVSLAPKEFSTSTERPALRSGFYRIEITYFSGGEIHHAAWGITHHSKTEIDAWEMPRS